MPEWDHSYWTEELSSANYLNWLNVTLLTKANNKKQREYFRV